MAIYEISQHRFEKIPETDFQSEGIKERSDLQRLLRNQVEVLAPNTLVISEEFGDWEDSRRRIDLLGLDKQANLVVIELKRTEQPAGVRVTLNVQPAGSE
jgi:RecB family endonuclease NucS